ncbi:Uncharacterised protein [Kingella potus]|uniref:Uncharacterized protein n=1 Tax=Kingella potus TaxID=265175 RepID=A0A377QZC2_9NEIS|nr:hypothetical protein [Kingella potus]UOP00931.1 hypothetical protein LVJ84_00485 [Kingella potus]STR00593.1 Uncharacterised protein [Kingella potus]
MKEFSYQNIIGKNASEKIVRRLIYHFFRGNIYSKKIMADGTLKEKTYFSFKRPFHGSDGVACSPDILTEVFPLQELYVLRHYNYQNNLLPLFLAKSEEIAEDLKDLDAICGYEYSYIFDKNFSFCFYISDSYLENNSNFNGDLNNGNQKYTAVLIKYSKKQAICKISG